MFAGERINVTEDRAVLHTALRAPADVVVMVDGHDVVPGVHEVLDRMGAFALRVRDGEWEGFTWKEIADFDAKEVLEAHVTVGSERGMVTGSGVRVWSTSRSRRCVRSRSCGRTPSES